MKAIQTSLNLMGNCTTMGMLLFIHGALTSTSAKETFLQDFLKEMFPTCKIDIRTKNLTFLEQSN